MLRPRKGVFFILALVASNIAFGSEYKTGEVIVRYKDGILRTRSNMNALYDSVGVTDVMHYSGAMSGYEVLKLDSNVKVEDAIAALHKDGSVEYAQPNYILHTMPIHALARAHDAPTTGIPCWMPGVPFPPGCDDGGTPGTPPVTPPDPDQPGTPTGTRPDLKAAPSDITPAVADPDLGKAYGLEKIGATKIWSTWKGSKNFIVADIDTGIDYNHEDLAFNVWRNPNPTDHNDVVGYDFVHNDGLPFDDNEHGTHTAGTIGAVGGNGIGVSGVSQRVSIMALKFLSGDGSGTTADAIRAIDYAIAHGARVMSNSWGGKGDPDNKALRDAVDRARVKDILFVAAAGNDGTDNDTPDPSYPAAFNNDNMLSVAATDESDGLAYFSNYGKTTTHVAAPGVNTYSTVPGNKYKTESGTSMACPHVAGAAALLWSRHPTWNYKKVKAVLMSTADQLPSLVGKTVSGGRINIQKALLSAE
jgi:subtilisin family serine protease